MITILTRVCEQQKISEPIDRNFCPGKFIMSQVLVSIIPEIEIKTGINIPLDCYIFYDNKKSRTHLSISDAVNKLKDAIHE